MKKHWEDIATRHYSNVGPRRKIIAQRHGRMLVAILALAALLETGCHSVPMTGRKQLLFVSEGQETTMGAEAYEETLSAERPSQNTQYITMVNRVGQRLAAVADRPDFAWEFRVIQSPEQNAFCLPGGKVAIYEGILPICQTEAGVAVVMAHEVAHALARHGAERVSHGYMVNGVKTALDTIAQNKPSTRMDRLLQGYGVASNYGFVLPYSRKHESEADEIGIILMARAGYDPSEAPRFWERFAQTKSGNHTPEFMSTHPSDERRAGDLQRQLSTAMAVYQQSPQKFGLGEPLAFHPPQPATAPTKTATTQAVQETMAVEQRIPADGQKTSKMQQASFHEPIRRRLDRTEFGQLNPLR